MTTWKVTSVLAAVSFFFAAGAMAQEPSMAEKINNWRALYPAEYYSSLGSADHMDDLDDKNFGYGHGSMSKFFGNSVEASKTKGGLNATCFSCKSAKFNDLYNKYGNEVFSGTKSTKYGENFGPEDYWSCETCHSDMKNPKASVGRQIITPAIFGKELFDKLPPKAAACAQCHNNLAPWSDSRIITSNDAIKQGKTAYRYGWDPEALIKATMEDAQPTGVRYPKGRTMEMSPAAHAKVSEENGTYLIANGNHADAELYMDSIHYKLGVGCADCHMPYVQDRSFNRFRSHDSSKSVLNSKASMQYCLTCHTNDKVKNVKDMYFFVRNAQQDLAKRDKTAADKLDQTYDLITQAVKSGKVDKETLDKARFDYARASFYKEYVYGNRGATPGEKVAHNPQMSRKYLDQSAAILDQTQDMLKKAMN